MQHISTYIISYAAVSITRVDSHQNFFEMQKECIRIETISLKKKM